MKLNLKTLTIVAFLMVAPLFIFAQPHPNGGNAPGVGNHPVGGSAPIGNGTLMLMVFAAAYAGRKVYQMRAGSVMQ